MGHPGSPFKEEVVESHICQNRADVGHPVFPPLKLKEGLHGAPKIPHLPKPGRCEAPGISPTQAKSRFAWALPPLKPKAGLHGAPKIPHPPTTGKRGAPGVLPTQAKRGLAWATPSRAGFFDLHRVRIYNELSG